VQHLEVGVHLPNKPVQPTLRDCVNMRCRSVILASLLVIPCIVASAADHDARKPPFVDKEFVILKSTPSFEEATRSAAQAASKLGVELNLRGLSPNLRTGLTFSKQECTRSSVPYPCYVPRGRGDDGTYVSVEWSSKYQVFAKGLYVVMIASDVAGSSETRRVLEMARSVYPHAYAERVKVYVGSMH
jgi:hypothetical protein